MNKLDKNSVIGISALLVHAANIDEIYSDNEKKLVKDFIKSYLKNEDANEVLKKAEDVEKNSNQLLNYTNIIKKNNLDIKKDIIEHLWKVIISDNSIDQYESNLMRRICGLIYFPDKESAEIKMKYRKGLLKKKAQVLFENRLNGTDSFFGRDKFNNSVIANSKENLIGKIRDVIITNGNHNTLKGEILKNETNREFAA